MGFAGDDQLHRALAVGENAEQPLRIVQQQIGTLVGGEAARKAQRQRFASKMLAGCAANSSGDAPRGHASCGQALWRTNSIRDLRAVGAHAATASRSSHARMCSSTWSGNRPATMLAAGFGPKRSASAESQVRNVNAVGDVADRHFGFRPAREKALKDPAADLAVQAADAVDRAAAAHGEIRHVERLGIVVGIGGPAPEVVERDSELSSA